MEAGRGEFGEAKGSLFEISAHGREESKAEDWCGRGGGGDDLKGLEH